MLKEKLLKLGIVIDNIFLDKYVNLINSCKNNTAIKPKLKNIILSQGLILKKII